MEGSLSSLENLNNFLFQKRDQILRRANLFLLDALSYRRDERLCRLNPDIRHQQSFLKIID